MADEVGLSVLIKSILDSKGFDELKKNLQDLKDKQPDFKKPKTDADSFSGALHDLTGNLMSTVVAYASVGAGIALFHDIVKSAIEGARALDQYNMINKTLGDSTEKSTEANKDWLDSVERASGVAKETLLPTYASLVAVTHSTTQAQALMQVALGASASGLGTVEENARSLTMMMTTGLIRGAGGLGAEMKKLQKEGKSTQEIFAIVSKQFGDAGASVHNAGIEVDRAKVQWKESKEAIGATATSLGATLAPALHAAALAIAMVVAGAIKFGTAFKIQFQLAGAAAQAFLAAVKGHFGEAKQIIKDAAAEAGKDWKAATEKATQTITGVEVQWNKSTGGMITGSKKLQDALNAAAANAGKQKKAIFDIGEAWKQVELHAMHEGKTEIEVTKLEIEGLNKILTTRKLSAKQREELEVKSAELTKRLALEEESAKQKELRDFETDLKIQTKSEEDYNKKYLAGIQQRLAGEKKGSEEWKKLKLIEIDLIGKIEKAEEEAEKRAVAADDRAVKRKIENAVRLAKAKKLGTVQALNAELQAIQQSLAADTMGVDENIALQEKEAEIEEALDSAKAAREEKYVGQSIGAAESLFGQSKGVAIAKAVISTYQGAAQSIADWGMPWGAVFAALAVAEGLAQVAKIESTDIGSKSGGGKGKSGFDDPANDFAAYVGGKQWAKDMVHQMSMGAARGFSDAMTKNVTHNDNRTNNDNRRVHNAVYHIHTSGLMDARDNVAMRRFVRNFQVASAQEAQRTLK
jgi:hypothetical protein